MSDKKKNKDQEQEPVQEAAENETVEETAEAPSEPAEPTAEELLAAEKDKYLRLYAEYANYRNRSQKERTALFAEVKSDTVLQILPIYDNLQRALSVPTSDEGFRKGIELTMTQLMSIFENLGVKPIEAVGQKFNADLHNAIMHIEDEAYGENEVVEEFQKGFILGDKVIRFSMVKVAN